MEEELNRYKKEFLRALEKFQFIEETLKMCLLSAIEIARIQLSPYFPIKYQSKDIKKLPLGPLINIFIKINDDRTLHRDLRKIREKRNQVAHESLLFTLGELNDKSFITNKIAEMKEIADCAEKIHGRVLDVRYQLVKVKNEVKRLQKKKNFRNK